MRVTMLQKKPGVWRLRVETSEGGKRRFSYEMVRGPQSAAEARKQQLERGASITRPDHSETFQAYFLRWIDDRHAYREITKSSVITYRNLLSLAFDLIGHKPIASLTKQDIEGTYRALVRRYPAQRVSNLAAQVRKGMRQAMEAGLIPTDPTVGVKAPKARADVKDNTLSPEQIATLLDACKTWGDTGEIVRFAFATGCRRGEICGLQWQDIDLAKGVVNIRRNVVAVEGELQIAKPKTRSSTRTITLPEAMRDELAARKGDARGTDWVWPNDFGGSFNPSTLTVRIIRKMKRIGLGDFTMHDLRHAHATLLIQQRFPLKAVSQRLGHSDVKITLQVYSHVMPGDDAALASAIDRLF